MPKPDMSPRLLANQGQDDLKLAALTRDDVAKRLGVSVSTVRRLEGTRLHPLIDNKSVRRFKASDVERLANQLEAEQRSPRNAQQAVVRAAQLSKGELAALVFERLEQRHSLAEIVIALRIPPEDVRDLYHAWLIGLCTGELQRPEPALPARHSDQDVSRRVTHDQLARMLSALPDNRPTRISVARVIGEYVVPDVADETPTSFTEYRNVNELGGFVVSGPIAASEITNRFGAGEYRITAYALDAAGMRWEVLATLEDDGRASRVA